MLKLNITWRDRRVDFLNLRDDIYQNILPDDEKMEMWVPEIGKFFLSISIVMFNQTTPTNILQYVWYLKLNINVF